MTARGLPGPLSLVLLAACGCGERGAGGSGAAGGGPVTWQAERGPVSLRVRADPEEVVAGGRIVLSVEAAAEPGVEVTMPQVGAELGPFAVRAARTPSAAESPGRRTFSHAYELDTFAAGEAEVPSLVLGYVDRRPGTLERLGEALEGELRSDPLRVSVRSALGPGDDTRAIKTAVGVPLPWRGSPLWWIVAAAGLAAAGAALLLVRYLRRRPGRRETAAEPVPAHEWAAAELERLAAAALVEAGRFHEFYYRLSDVVRQYVERSFGLMAPERTTEEFLREARRSRVLRDEHKSLLAGFLRAADLVKFARHVPAAGDALEALAAARRFVEQTVPAAAPVPGTPVAEAAA